eukprot:7059296-Alexandrium_andersonii.AAC.1
MSLVPGCWRVGEALHTGPELCTGSQSGSNGGLFTLESINVTALSPHIHACVESLSEGAADPADAVLVQERALPVSAIPGVMGFAGKHKVSLLCSPSDPSSGKPSAGVALLAVPSAGAAA